MNYNLFSTDIATHITAGYFQNNLTAFFRELKKLTLINKENNFNYRAKISATANKNIFYRQNEVSLKYVIDRRLIFVCRN